MAVGELWWMVEIATLIALARMAEVIFSKVGLPKVMGYILVGMAIPLMNYELTEITSSLAVLGIVVYLFYLGLEGSLRGFIRGLRDAGLIALGGVAGSVALPIMALIPLGVGLKEAFALGVALSATSVTLTLKTLGDMGYEGSRVGQAITGAAVVDDVLGLALLSTVYSLEAREFPAMTLIEIVAGAFGFWLAVSYSLERLGKSMIKLALKTPMEEPLLSVIFVVLLVLSYIAAQLQFSAILLAYAVGLGFSRYRYEARYVSNRMLTLIALFTPLFFIKAGSLVDIRIILNAFTPSLLTVLVTVVTIGILSKIVGCTLTALVLGFSRAEALLVGIGMTPRAEVMLTAALAGRELGLLSDEIYLGLLLLVPITSIIVPPLMSAILGRVRLR